MPEDLSQRRLTPERMDGLDLPVEAHRAALAGLERLNLLSFHVRPFWNAILPLAQASGRPLRVLDLACGGGGLVIGLRKRAARAGLELQVDGCDRSPVAVAFAEEQALRAGVSSDGRFFECDLSAFGAPEGYDILVNSLFLHHLRDEEALQFLIDLSHKANMQILISDILRTRLGWWLVNIACRLFGASDIVVDDGRTSLRAAFTLPELEALAARVPLPGVEFRRHWPQRALLSWLRGIEIDEPVLEIAPEVGPGLAEARSAAP